MTLILKTSLHRGGHSRGRLCHTSIATGGSSGYEHSPFCYTFRATQPQEKPMVQRMFSARICSVLILLAAVLTAIAPATLHAQDISGDWQGTLHAGQDLRVIVHIEKNVAEPKDTQKNAAEKNAADKDGKQEAAKVEKKDAGKAEKKDADKKDI